MFVVAALAVLSPIDLLVFTRTKGFRHDSIPVAIEAFKELENRGWRVHATEDPTDFSAGRLRRYDVIAFVLTTGDVLDDVQQAAMEGFVEAGGGFVGVHSATDTEYEWPWYGRLVGAWFKSHPAVQQATVRLEDSAHPTMGELSKSWVRIDEWYDLRRSPRPESRVLATVDESTYQGGLMGADHPVTWCTTAGKGRSWTTVMGHTADSYKEGPFVEMLARAVEWAAHRGEDEIGLPSNAREPERVQPN